MTIPDWQTLAVLLIVAGAVAFLGWKVFGSERKPRPRRGPDVPIANLVRKVPANGRRIQLDDLHPPTGGGDSSDRIELISREPAREYRVPRPGD